MKKRLLAAVVAATMVVGLCGCGAGKTTEEPAKPEQTESAGEQTEEAGEKVFVSAVSSIPETFFKAYFNDAFTTMTRGLWEPLFYVSNGKTEYYLIDDLKASEDGLMYTFHMADNATWSDGEAITTDDVFYSFEVEDVWDDVYSSSFRKVSGEPIVYEQVDEHTFTATLPKPSGTFLREFSIYFKLLPKHVFDGDPQAAVESEKFTTTDIVTSGAFTLSEINQDSFVLTARDDFYRGKPGVDKIVYRLLGEGVSQQVAFDNGEISVMRLTNSADYEKYKNDSNYNVVSIPEDKFTYLLFNQVNFETKLNEDARKAICMALNADEIVQGAYGTTALAEPATSVICPGFSIYEGYEGYQQNMEEAKKLAESSGLTNETLNYVYSDSNPNAEAIATMVQAELAQIGVKVNIQGYDYSTFSDIEYSGSDEWDFLTNGVDSMRGDGLPDVGFLTNEWIDSGWNETVQNLAFQINAEPDLAKQKELAKELHQAALDNHVCYPLTWANCVYVTPSNISGLDASAIVPEFVDMVAITMK